MLTLLGSASALAAPPAPESASQLASPSSTSSLDRGFVRGMTFAHVHSREWGYGSERAKRELERLRDVGVDWIAISPFAYQKKVDEPFLYYGPGDPTMLDRDLVAVTEHAHALGIRVFLKPHLWSGEFWSSGKWPGDIEMKTPEAEESWWRSYTGYIVAQAKLAALAKMDALSIGHELVKMTAPRHTPRWRALITEVKRHFGGPLVYGANHGHEVGQIEFWDALDAVGVHAYYPLGGDALEAASADDIARAWLPVLAELRKIADKTKKPLVFTEVGFPAHRGALAKPWEADGARPLDEGLQARAYEGTLRALASAPFVRGTFWWKWFSGGHENPHEREPYDPSGKAAERVLKRWYRGG